MISAQKENGLILVLYIFALAAKIFKGIFLFTPFTTFWVIMIFLANPHISHQDIINHLKYILGLSLTITTIGCGIFCCFSGNGFIERKAMSAKALR